MKPRVAVHKFSSCDGCQLAFLNAGEDLLKAAALVDFVHFAEAGMLDEQAKVDIAFVEGSISTPQEVERIQKVRAQSDQVISIGACATSGGLQALRNLSGQDASRWLGAVYDHPEYLQILDKASPISDYVRIDGQIWGCPVNGAQVLHVMHDLLAGIQPFVSSEKVCLECKRQQHVCTLITKQEACMGAVTRAGCQAICPAVGRDCFGCFGPSESPNTGALARRFEGFGLLPEAIAAKFLHINSASPEFHREGEKWKELTHD